MRSRRGGRPFAAGDWDFGMRVLVWRVHDHGKRRDSKPIAHERSSPLDEWSKRPIQQGLRAAVGRKPHGRRSRMRPAAIARQTVRLGCCSDHPLKSRRQSDGRPSVISGMSPFTDSFSATLRLALMSMTIGMLLSAGVADAQRAPATKSDHHEHHAPHKGTLVELGEEFAHLELVLNAQTGTLTAYVLDGEAEQSVRIAQPTIEVRLRLPGSSNTLEMTLSASANPLTGETVGESSQFQAQSDALKSVSRFSGIVKHVTAKGGTFDNVAFRFPEGNEH
jgi:hypothetical protein